MGFKATASTLFLRAYDGGDAKCDPSFGTSKQLAGYGRDLLIAAVTAGTGGGLDSAEAAAGGCPWGLCFTASTPVQMADGSVEAISLVQPGD